MDRIEINKVITLDAALQHASPAPSSWVKENTAILVFHGIGNQLPLETLDQFGRGLIAQYKKLLGDDLIICHELAKKNGSNDSFWFDNVVRLKNKLCPGVYIDIYEYYWANYTEDQASLNDINRWLQGVVKGANKFYTRNAELGKLYKDQSPFFNDRTGAFNVVLYRFFLATATNAFKIISLLTKGLIWLVSLIPLLGRFAADWLESFSNSQLQNLVNVIGDIVIYNVVDPKSKFYEIRREIMDGGVHALRYLLEKTNIEEGEETETENETEAEKRVNNLYYPSVLVAGHSLGSQIAYDTINRINLLANQNVLKTYHSKGKCNFDKNRQLSHQLRGLITFGSPLDKIVFFLRENVPDNQYLRQKFLDHYHGFKIRDLNGKGKMEISCELERLLEDIPWRNYFDNKDYVSGALDYYHKLVNIDCRYTCGTFGFTHSYYWEDERFFKDVINNYLTS